MKPPAALILAAALAAPAAAAAEDARAYRCTDASDGRTVELRIGADLLRQRQADGSWGDNLCRHTDAFCANEDDGYIVEGPNGLYLKYRFRDGGFDFASAATGEMTGVCRPIGNEPPKR